MTLDPSRVKRGTETEKRGLARYAAKPKAVRPENIGLLKQAYTALLQPHGKL